MKTETPDTKTVGLDGRTRRFTHDLADLQERARKIKHNGAPITPVLLDLVDDALTLSTMLIQELAGAQLHQRKLQADLGRSDMNWHHLFERLPVASLITDATGTVVSANRHAALLLNTSAKHLRGKLLLHFFDNRAKLVAMLETVASGGKRVEQAMTIRPRERSTRETITVIVPESTEQTGHFLWFLTPAAVAARAGLTVEHVGDQLSAS